MKKREIIIIGGGPGGLSAAVYAKRYMLDVEIISKDIGGTVLNAHEICNFLTYPKIKGIDLAKKMKEHIESLNVPVILSQVNSIEKAKDHFAIKTEKGNFSAKKVIFGTGTFHNKLNVSGEKEFLGKGVSYCATCDGPLFREKIVAVVGGGNAALTSALMLSDYASKVYLIHRRDEFRAEPTWVNQVKKNKKIELVLNDEVKKINGEKFVTSATLKSGKNLKINGIFIEIGSFPDTSIINFDIQKDKKGYIKVDETMQTSQEGFFAIGDVASKKFRQVATAVSDGAVAAVTIYEQLKKGDI